MPDPKVHGPRHKAIDGLVKANLGSGRMTIELRTKTNMRYTAGRAANETVQVVNEAEVVPQKVVVAAHRRQTDRQADDNDCSARQPRRPCGRWGDDVISTNDVQQSASIVRALPRSHSP